MMAAFWGRVRAVWKERRGRRRARREVWRTPDDGLLYGNDQTEEQR